MKTVSGSGSLPVYSSSQQQLRSTSGSFQPSYKPRANPPPIRAIELMGINLHEEKEPSRDVDLSDVTTMRSKMGHHSEETNELFNLMARQIKKRCEERINLFTVENVESKALDTMSENEMDQYILSNEDVDVEASEKRDDI